MTDDATGKPLDDPRHEKDLTLDFDDPTLMHGHASPTPSRPISSSMTPDGAGHIASRYEILGLLGSGGMGNVYKVRDMELDEVVALKTLHASLRENDQALKRFRREVKLARLVTHPNVARTFDLGTDAQTPYLTMEFVEGDTLYSYIHRNRRQHIIIEPLKAIEITCEIARGLEAAHLAGVIHRDLKPANVMITRDERIVITDFGIARISSGSDAITALDGMVGTPLYMSPEQVEGSSDIDHRTDLYALGVMLYEMLTNTSPFEGDTPVALALARILHTAPSLAHAGLPHGLAEIVASMLERDPALRYPDAGALISALSQVAHELSGDSHPLLHHTPPPGSSHHTASPQQSTKHRTVAIFPLSHSDSEQDTYLTEGFAEEIVGELSMAPNIRVKPLSAVKTLLAETAERDPLRLGARLGVDVVVTGSLREQGDKLRIRLSMLSVREGFQIWGEKFMAPASDLFITAEDAAEALAGALTSQVEEERRPEALTDPVAVDAYMRGRYLLQLKWFEDISEALDMFRAAQKRVPDDPRVLTGLATAMARQVFFEPAQARVLLQQARQYARRASDLVPRWPEPHYAMAMIAYAEGDYTHTIIGCQRALTLSPDHIEAHDLLGRVLAEVGPLDESSYHLNQALTLNESLYRAWWDLMRVLALQQRWDEVDDMLTRSTHIPVHHNANQSFLFRLHCWRGQSARSFQANFVEEDLDPRFGIVFDTVRQIVQDGELSEEYIHSMQTMARHIPSGSQHIKIFLQLNTEFALLSGHDDLAYRAIESAMNEGLRDLMWLEHLPLMDHLRQEPRFTALLERARQTLSPVRATLTPHSH